ncbi:MAG: hypothetical protein GY774_11665 [Planctomycetes bacterium]|nr:hypothetical protein [Planctomycetota bacterium]
MKLLLDEQLPRQLATCFPDSFEVRTVQQMGWGSTTNGRLLRLAADHGFVALVTVDKNIEYQHNLATLPTMVIVLDAYGNRLQDLEPFVPGVIDVLARHSDLRIYRVQKS